MANDGHALKLRPRNLSLALPGAPIVGPVPANTNGIPATKALAIPSEARHGSDCSQDLAPHFSSREWHDRACAPNEALADRCSKPLSGPTPLLLSFVVSSDEEHVHLYAIQNGLSFDLGSRNHNYLLLTLARRRLVDRAGGLSESACGWFDPDEFAHDVSMASDRINLDVHRIRRQFAARNLAGATEVIERRMRVRQLRLGIRRIAISVV